jgi:nitroimidazol reductase NimA-like FMN-containing flavoprotein (pyridoxamine 5'-phosphate oxidase superfamily)
MSQEEIGQLLQRSRIGRLCMADGAGRPYAIPLPFCYLDAALYLRLPPSGRKAHILAQNPKVCFEVDEFTPTLDDYCSVLLEGELVTVTDLAEKARVRQANTAKYQLLRSGNRRGHGRTTPLEELPLQKIRVESLTGRKKEK